MAEDKTIIDTLSLDDFCQRLLGRLDETSAALDALMTAPVTGAAGFGEFHDALQTAARLRVLHEQYVERLRRLANAVTAAQDATASIAADYRTVEALNSASLADIRQSLGRVGEALNDGQRHA